MKSKFMPVCVLLVIITLMVELTLNFEEHLLISYSRKEICNIFEHI
jgi:hypothetical protein